MKVHRGVVAYELKFEPQFHDNSYGFRTGRICGDVIEAVIELLNIGYEWVVDIDLQKFFDNVPRDRLMSYVNRVIHDGDTEVLICRYLKAGVMNKGRCNGNRYAAGWKFVTAIE